MNSKERKAEYDRKYRAEYYLKHRNKILAQTKYTYRENKKKYLEYAKKYREDNKEKKAIYNKEYHQNNKEQILAQQKEYRQKYKEQIAVRDKNSKQKNRYQINKRNQYRKKTDIQYKLSCNLRNRLRMAIKNNAKSGSAVRDLGCTIPELKFYIEGQFQDGMSWDNWGHTGNVWHIDHKIPLSFFDLTDREQFLKAVHYTNLQPMWAKENLLKSSKIILKGVTSP